MSNRACLMHRLTLALAVQARVNVSESMSVCVTSEARVHAAAGAARKRQTQAISHSLALQTLLHADLDVSTPTNTSQVHAPERTRVCTHVFITTGRDKQDKDTRELVCAGGGRRMMIVPAPSPFPPHSPLPQSPMSLSAAFFTGWQNVLASRCTSAGRMEHINIALAHRMHAHRTHTHKAPGAGPAGDSRLGALMRLRLASKAARFCSRSTLHRQCHVRTNTHSHT
jgi:hypothetical protein